LLGLSEALEKERGVEVKSDYVGSFLLEKKL
jgi:transposase